MILNGLRRLRGTELRRLAAQLKLRESELTEAETRAIAYENAGKLLSPNLKRA